jgi:hypothetical protein
MKKIKNVKKISLFLVGKQNKIIEEVELPTLSKDEVELPIDFNYNGDWEMKHFCCNCNDEVQVSMKRIKEFPLSKYQNWALFSSADDTGFSLENLEDISKIFKEVVLMEDKNRFFVASNKSIENNFPMSISISFHKCNACKAYYLSHFYNSSGFVEERNGKIYLPQLTFMEIVCIEIDENEDVFFRS